MWHTVVVPRGGGDYICLSDGSEVWLNSETKISYPVYFTGDLRGDISEWRGLFQSS